MKLHFNPADIPRSTTRADWRKIWRWKREVEKRLQADLDRRMTNLFLYGTTHPEIYETLADEIVNPPLLVRE